MIFVLPVTIPANTPATAPVTKTLPIAAGTITRMAIQVPSGVVALAHMQIFYGLHQLFPTNQDGDFATSNETITWDEEQVVDQPPFQLTVVAWNTDTVFSHTLTIRVIMRPLETRTDLATEISKLLESHQAAA